MSKTPVNFLGGSPLNRLSWLRTSSAFINTLIDSPSTQWIAFQDGKPLIASRAKEARLALLTTAEVEPFLGSKPYFGQGYQEGEIPAVDLPILEAARFRGAPTVFLGVSEPKANDYPPTIPPEELARVLVGTTFFSIDLTEVGQAELDHLVQTSTAGTDGYKLTFAEARGAARNLSDFDGAVFAEARSMVDWNSRNKFCASWGRLVELSCTSLLSSSDNAGRKPCITQKGVHNITHPRTDAVVIVAVLNEAQDKILLGQSKKFPPKFYSTLAGFIEPGESFEDAVKRELWEEAGIRVWDVKYHSVQPWPFPANLMVGFYATGDPSEPIRTDLDKELEDARWYTREEVLTVLQHKEGTNFSRNDYKQLTKELDERVNVKLSGSDPLSGDAAAHDPISQPQDAHGVNEPPFRVPPRTAIAGVLISDWALGNAVTTKGRM
ncbi:NUDIX hydrolase domain-like protein [Lactarius quietus]|nr:NUDIX hydrolase domain-like protein [Lactarius quietus]